jgi:hypothetical protein
VNNQNDSVITLGSVTSDLDKIDQLPVGEHAEALENVHRALEAALSTVDGL